MLVHKLTAPQCREVLARTRLGRLGCARSNQPYVVPISVYFDPDENVLYGFSTIGQKIRWMRENPLVCVEVDEIVSRHDWTTVVAFGRYVEIPRGALGANFRRRAYELFEHQAEWWLPGAANLAAGERRAAAVVYRIRLNRLTGRRVVR
jgi:nitroimidazol reductase NimA-like FMN-containing flavoprotein (pyridoxamine 5'-phosphate oxidase superfamily)